MKYCFLIPSQTSLGLGEKLNVLLGVEPDGEDTFSFRFWGNIGGEWRELYSETREELLKENEPHLHLYFSIPGECFTEEFWGEVPEELELTAGAHPMSGVKASLIDII